LFRGKLERLSHLPAHVRFHLRHAEALAAAEALTVTAPDNCDVLYLIAVNQRCLRRFLEALATLERLEERQPQFSRLYQERGHCCAAMRDVGRAIDAFRRGVNINPALTASWSMLEHLYRVTADAKNAALAAEQVATLRNLPPEVVQAGSVFSDGELILAENTVRAYLFRGGKHIEAMRLLARIGIDRGVFEEAELLLEAVLELAPDYRAARHDYVRALLERHKYLRAREELETLLRASINGATTSPGSTRSRKRWATHWRVQTAGASAAQRGGRGTERTHRLRCHIVAGNSDRFWVLP
jgi:tetratricopeptide (TPR) repeat protein